MLFETNMPHSIASKKRVIGFFEEDVYKELRHNTTKLKQYRATIKKLRESAASPAKVIKTINRCLKWYPGFCNCIIGFDPDGGMILKETQQKPTSTPAPANFTTDIVPSIISFLPFPLVGRLAMTCKWMNANITEAQVEQALEKARPVFGKTELLTEPSSGRVMLRLFNTEGNMLEVGKIHPDSRILVVKDNGRTFIAGAPICRSEVIMYAALGDATSEPPKMWFKFNGIRRDSSFTVNFITIDGIDPYFSHEFITFYEFVN